MTSVINITINIIDMKVPATSIELINMNINN